MNKEFHINADSACISEKVLFDYMDNKLDPSQRHEVEKHLLDCELCSDALEGLTLVKDRNKIAQLKNDVQRLVLDQKGQSGPKVVKLDFRSKLAIAAGLALLIGSIGLFRYVLNQEKVVADLTTEEKAVPQKQEPAASPAPITSLEQEKKAMDEAAQEESTKPNVLFKAPAPRESERNQMNEGSLSVTLADSIIPAMEEPAQKYKESEANDKSRKAEEYSAYQEGKYNNELAKMADSDESSGMGMNSENKSTAVPASKPVMNRQESKSEEDRKKTSKEKTKRTRSISSERYDADPQPAQAPATTDSEIIMADEKPKDDSQEKQGEEIFTVVEQMPEFPGGDDALQKFITKNLVYPKTAMEQGLGGIVYVGFVVQENGSLADVKILRGINACKECNDEALRIIKAMPLWTPGKQNNRPVKVQLNVPIKFTTK